jgi:hypothetical protein
MDVPEIIRESPGTQTLLLPIPGAVVTLTMNPVLSPWLKKKREKG